MLVQLGPIVTQAAGSIGGTTFQRSNGATIVRVKPLPIRKRTTYTNTERSMSQYLSRQWRAVSQANKDAWQLAADGLTWENRFGDTIRGLGYWLWMRCSFNRTVLGLSVVESAPTIAAVGAITGLAGAVGVGSGTFQLTWSSGNVPAAETWAVYATAPMSPGNVAGWSRYRFIRTVPAASASAFSIRTAYVARHGALPTTSQRVFVRVVPYLTASGLPGTPVQCIPTVS